MTVGTVRTSIVNGVLQGIGGGGRDQRGDTSIQEKMLPVVPALHTACLKYDCRSQRNQSQVVVWSITLVLLLGESGTRKEDEGKGC